MGRGRGRGMRLEFTQRKIGSQKGEEDVWGKENWTEKDWEEEEKKGRKLRYDKNIKEKKEENTVHEKGKKVWEGIRLDKVEENKKKILLIWKGGRQEEITEERNKAKEEKKER